MISEETPAAASQPRQLQLPQLHGVLVLNKPSGPTSARCLTALKRLGQKKIGHAGTLDPLASGVLLVLLGQATKLSSHLMAGGGKVYSGVLRLGQTTDTWDCQGQVLAEDPWQHVDEEDVRREIALWREARVQPVPPYSAAKHEGQPLYKLARKGAAAPAKVKRMEISQADTLKVSLPFVRFRVTCSSGTYIRSLAHSLGMRLGCGAVLTELTREYSHPFGLDAARDLRDLTDDPTLLAASLRPIAEALPHWPRVELTPEQAQRVRNGIAVPCAPPMPDGGGTRARNEDLALLLDRGEALALARREDAPDGLYWAVLRGLWN
ncbi:tRNA pseudouridine(55) synthase TruB [uncultured Desulfovibrio sp.]|uniref:tRNA pseudouridine(55) synthase TruB n=1 Tax=uncultured Desulfovibrio sp. TaxID=167968 RepID=UPI00260D85E4|nr:tRNA pseudouridine(55) synthase TruB [uncultured Desulfovibrio sp.]